MLCTDHLSFGVPPGMAEVEALGSRLLVYLEHNTQCKYMMDLKFEDGAMDWARKTVRTGDWVADIGAHVGIYTCLLARLVGPPGHVFAFEPEMQHATALALNVMRNGLGNVTVLPSACGEKTMLTRFSAGACGDQHQGSGDQRAWQVRIDDVLPRLDGFKMDSQGDELGILAGMAGVLKTLRWGLIENHGDLAFASVMESAGLIRVGDARREQFFFERKADDV